jgi:hypothetical protein
MADTKKGKSTKKDPKDELGRAKAKIGQLEAKLKNREKTIREGIPKVLGLIKKGGEKVDVQDLVQNALLVAYDRDDAQSKAKHLQEKNEGLVKRLRDAAVKGDPSSRLVLKNAVIFKPKHKGPIIAGEDAKTEWGQNINDFYARFVAAFGTEETKPEQKPAPEKKKPDAKPKAPEKKPTPKPAPEKKPTAKPKTPDKKPAPKPAPEKKKPEAPKPEPKNATYDDLLTQVKEQLKGELAKYGITEDDIEQGIQDVFLPKQKLYFRKGKVDTALMLAYFAKTHGLPEEAGNITINLTYILGDAKPAAAETEKEPESVDTVVETATPDKDADSEFAAAYATAYRVHNDAASTPDEKETAYQAVLACEIPGNEKHAGEIFDALGVLQNEVYEDYASAEKNFKHAIDCAEEVVKANPDSKEAQETLARYKRNLEAAQHNQAVLTEPKA